MYNQLTMCTIYHVRYHNMIGRESQMGTTLPTHMQCQLIRWLIVYWGLEGLQTHSLYKYHDLHSVASYLLKFSISQYHTRMTTVSTGVSRCSDIFRLVLVETFKMCQYVWITVMLGLTHARMITLALRTGWRIMSLFLESLPAQLLTPAVHFMKYMEMERDSVTQYGEIIMPTLLTWTTAQWWCLTAVCPIQISNLRSLGMVACQNWSWAQSLCVHQHCWYLYSLQLTSSNKFPRRET